MTSFEETELRLGLPGGGGSKTSEGSGGEAHSNNGKRSYEETIMDLKLKLSSDDQQIKNDQKIEGGGGVNPPAKAQVVGWPPVRCYRKNILSVQKNINNRHEECGGAAFVKVSMDGAPYLRKVDLKMYKSYQDLSDGLGKLMFTGGCINGAAGFKMNETKLLMDLLNNSDYVPTYQDKDGDWMLVGDVPWEMFVDSCKRLRIMKGKEAINGLALRAMEIYKNRS